MLALLSKSEHASVGDRVRESAQTWIRDLHELFENAQDRFGDVSWIAEGTSERIWGHKAPKAFKERYFSTMHPAFSIAPNEASPDLSPRLPSESSSPSMDIYQQVGTVIASSTSLSILDFDGGAKTSEGANTYLLQGDTSELFQAQLEWLYTGEGFGNVVDWISSDRAPIAGAFHRDPNAGQSSAAGHRDKLGQDLTYMWRSKLFADVRIRLIADDIEACQERALSAFLPDDLSLHDTFTSHRFILASRSPYFRSVLLNSSSFRAATDELSLPTSAFTPAALHFCLGYMYAGHLDFSHRTFDLTTAFHIHRAASYLQLQTLVNEIEARIAHDFCHGLDWNICRCQKCPARAARVWKITTSGDIHADALKVRARDYMAKGWSESWTKDVACANGTAKAQLLRDVISKFGPANITSTFRSVRRSRQRIDALINSNGRAVAEWTSIVADMVQIVEDAATCFVCTHFSDVVSSDAFAKLLSGGDFDTELLEHILDTVVEYLGTTTGCSDAPLVYQVLHVDLKASSTHQSIVHRAREKLRQHISKRWLQIRDTGAFQNVADELQVELANGQGDLLRSAVRPTPISVVPYRSHPRSARVVVDDIHRNSEMVNYESQGEYNRFERISQLGSPSLSSVNARSSSGLRRLRLSSSTSTTSAQSMISCDTLDTTTTSKSHRNTPRLRRQDSLPQSRPRTGSLGQTSNSGTSATSILHRDSSRLRNPKADRSAQSPILTVQQETKRPRNVSSLSSRSQANNLTASYTPNGRESFARRRPGGVSAQYETARTSRVSTSIKKPYTLSAALGSSTQIPRRTNAANEELSMFNSTPLTESPPSNEQASCSPLLISARPSPERGALRFSAQTDSSENITPGVSRAPRSRPNPGDEYQPAPRWTAPRIELNIGIPCIVSLIDHKARFRAMIRFIGMMNDASGPWVGVEVDDLSKMGVKTLLSGSKDGVTYFELSCDGASRSARSPSAFDPHLPKREAYHAPGPMQAAGSRSDGVDHIIDASHRGFPQRLEDTSSLTRTTSSPRQDGPPTRLSTERAGGKASGVYGANYGSPQVTKCGLEEPETEDSPRFNSHTHLNTNTISHKISTATLGLRSRSKSPARRSNSSSPNPDHNRGSSSGNHYGSGSSEVKRKRALFVRPSEIVFVMGGEL
ncbi:hypothetical protein IAU59_004901 [Kwoniella sp. CBS 9459]